MSTQNIHEIEPPQSQLPEPKTRPVVGTEYSWCRAVPVGTGITVLSLLLSKPPDISLLHAAIHRLQTSHAILRSKLRFTAVTGSFSFLTPASNNLIVQEFDLQTTNQIVSRSDRGSNDAFHVVLEHELNKNSWTTSSMTDTETDVFNVSLYTMDDDKWTAVMRLHTSACDRTAAVTLLRELLELMSVSGSESESTDVEVSLGIEDYIPNGKANKPFWVRGVDVIGYSLNSFRLANLEFVDADSPRRSCVVRLQINAFDTKNLVDGCKSHGIKLSGALAAAGLLASYLSKEHPDDHREKYAVVTLLDCRSILDPVLSSHHLGFYHSAILNTHDINGEENLWELAKRCYMAFANAKNNGKHFTDMSDLNFLMCKAIDNPGLTPSSSLRTAFISVFEDVVIDDSSATQQAFGLEDYVGCSSVHGVGPSIALFDTIRNGSLECACVYPSPLHSREQMQKLIDSMTKILVAGCNETEGKG